MGTSAAWSASGEPGEGRQRDGEGRRRRRWSIGLGVLLLVAAASGALLVTDAADGVLAMARPAATTGGDAVDTRASGPEATEAGPIPAPVGDERDTQRAGPAGDEPAHDDQQPEPSPEDQAPGDQEADSGQDEEPTGQRGHDEADDEVDDGDADGADEDEDPAGDVVAVQEQLRELRLLLGPADGVAGPRTRAAVMAFQRINDLQVDGVVGPRTLDALERPAQPELRGGPDTRIEVDLSRQLLHLVEDGRRVVTLHVSSGSGRTYETASGGLAYSNTPVGEFVVERRIAGVRDADLGTLYDPLYFYRGWAIHGSNSVPAHPASHGCIRVTRADGRWLLERVPDGTPVQLYGGTHVFTPSR